jgi:hypothetical protein
MCTVIIATLTHPAWPLLLAANRDELLARPWAPPAQHWPNIIAGKDTLAGGTWLGLNRHGVIATILNRVGTLGPTPGKRSRGELPLAALQHPTAHQAATHVATLDSTQWRAFNMLIADRETAIFLRGTGAGPITALPLPPGIHMITAHDPNDPASPRTARFLPLFRAAPLPNPPDWSPWKTLLAEPGLFIPPTSGFGTVASSVIGLGPATQFEATLNGNYEKVLLF